MKTDRNEEVSPLNSVKSQSSIRSQASIRLLNFLSMSNAPPAMTIEFINMNASVPKTPGSKEFKTIINNISGRIEPGQLVALMGPSGAGKSTLLNVLGSRFIGECSGDVFINNQPRSKRFKKHIGYVLQHDYLLPNLTVKETLCITANLRLSNALTQTEKLQRVDDIISVMGLTTCQHTLVQSVSGGESKRVSIANELLINPSILFLDEPTSGLDSTSAFSILTTLQELCRQGRTVICAIHQPSSQMFQKFDILMLLASANVIYFGNAMNVTDYFESRGYKCPIHYNPADFILELVTDNFCSEDESLQDKEKVKNQLIASWKTYTKQDNGVGIRDHQTTNIDNEEDVTSRWNSSWFEQFKILYIRAFKHRRGHLWSWIRLIEIGCISMLGGLVWFRIDHVEANIQDYMAASFFIAIFLMFSVMYRGVVHFPLEKEVIKKERQSGAYRLSAYYLSKIVAEFPVDICFPILAMTIFYWLVGMADDVATYLWFLATTCLALLASNAFGVMCGCSVSTFDYALTLLVVFGMFMMALSGFMIKDRAIPEWIRWIKYVSFMRYGYLGGVMVLLNHVTFECAVLSVYQDCVDADSSGYIKGDAILDEFQVTEPYWLSMVLLSGLSLSWFTIAYVFLRKGTATNG
eukprot:20604_1